MVALMGDFCNGSGRVWPGNGLTLCQVRAEPFFFHPIALEGVGSLVLVVFLGASSLSPR